MRHHIRRAAAPLVGIALLLSFPATALAAAPANDNFADGAGLVGAASSVTGTTVDATHQALEPCLYGYCSPSVWYRWTPAASGTNSVTFSTCVASFDTTLAVYTGTDLTNIATVGFNDDSGTCGYGSAVTFNASHGTVYHVRVSGYMPSNVGTFTLAYPAGGTLPGTDTTAPVLSLPASVSAYATSSAGATVTWSATATDAVDGTVAVTCSPSSGSTFPVGTTSVSCTARDAAGNTATGSFPVSVTYEWSGVLDPINADGSSVFRGRAVPVQFQLTGASAGITDIEPRLYIAKLTGDIQGTEAEATSTSGGTSGNLFSLTEDGTWAFHLATKNLDRGTWRLRIDLGDGVTRTVNISLA